MAEHRFRVGQQVHMTQRYPDTGVGGVYEVVRLMPQTANGELHYRVKAASGQERAVSEAQLSAAAAALESASA